MKNESREADPNEEHRKGIAFLVRAADERDLFREMNAELRAKNDRLEALAVGLADSARHLQFCAVSALSFDECEDCRDIKKLLRSKPVAALLSKAAKSQEGA